MNVGSKSLAACLHKATGAEIPLLNWEDPVPDGAFAFRVVSAGADSKLAFCHADWECDENGMTFTGNDGLSSEPVPPWVVSIGSEMIIFDWLDRNLGCRWLWPGELGEVIPHADTITVTLGQGHYQPALHMVHWVSNGDNKHRWADPKSWELFISNSASWMVHNRLYNDMYYQNYSHGFTDWYARFHLTHPEFFNLLPDGTRRPDPNYVGGDPAYISMCVSNPDFIRQCVQDWLDDYDPKYPMVNICENDTAGRCTCDKCMEWDESPVPTAKRRAEAKRRFERGRENWYKALGSLTNRYMKFYQAVLEEVDRVAPERHAEFAGLIYANYVEPTEYKLNDRFYMRYCPAIMFPWTQEKIDKYIHGWDEWKKTGANLFFRPNFPNDGHNFPINYAHEFAQCFHHAYENGMYGAELDSNTGNYITMGTTFYMIARLGCRPEMTEEQVLEEYLSAFGGAKDELRAYFDRLAELSHLFATDPELSQNASLVGGGFSEFVTVAPVIFTPEIFTELYSRLDQAESLAQGDETAVKRVQWLKLGLRHAELTAKTQKGYELYKHTGDRSEFERPLKALNAFRDKHETEYIGNLGWLRFLESLNWK